MTSELIFALIIIVVLTFIAYMVVRGGAEGFRGGRGGRGGGRPWHGGGGPRRHWGPPAYVPRYYGAPGFPGSAYYSTPVYITDVSTEPDFMWCGLHGACSSNLDILEKGKKDELATCPSGYQDQGFRTYADDLHLRVCENL
jgi:hypothetical protein